MIVWNVVVPLIVFVQCSNADVDEISGCRTPINNANVVHFSNDQHCYQIFSQSLSWEEAENMCVNGGGNLFSVHGETTVANLSFVCQFAKDPAKTSKWLIFIAIPICLFAFLFVYACVIHMRGKAVIRPLTANFWNNQYRKLGLYRDECDLQ